MMRSNRDQPGIHLTVITGWSPGGWEEYGRRFLETFDRFWPASIDLVIYSEELRDLPSLGRRSIEQRRLDDVPGCAWFLKTWNVPIARGEVPAVGYERRWKPKHFNSDYNFRFDAWKFCRQGFIPFHAASALIAESIQRNDSSEQLLCWLDGDVVTHSPVPAGFIEGLLPANADVAFLGRGDKHSEIGFQLYRINDASLRMLHQFSDVYVSEKVFDLKEWHSAYVFDLSRRASGIRAHDLTPCGHGHVWHDSPLARYTDHLKGKRKGHERSPERRVS